MFPIFYLLLLLVTSSVVQARNLRASTRIVGGHAVASAALYPFFGDWWAGCGTSLIAPDVVLTAGHCENLNPMNPDYPITFGTVKTGDKDAVKYYVRDYKVHPDYNIEAAGWRSDFMVMVLDKNVTGITPIALNTDARVPVSHQQLTVIGNGHKAEAAGVYSATLQEVNVQYIEGCDKWPYSYSQYSFIHPAATDVHLCAGQARGGKDSCYGDSGGPLFFKDANTSDFTQVGVVSWGDGCAQADKPGVYARISTAHEWIHQTMCDLTNEYVPSCHGDHPNPNGNNSINGSSNTNGTGNGNPPSQVAQQLEQQYPPQAQSSTSTTSFSINMPNIPISKTAPAAKLEQPPPPKAQSSTSTTSFSINIPTSKTVPAPASRSP